MSRAPKPQAMKRSPGKSLRNRARKDVQHPVDVGPETEAVQPVQPPTSEQSPTPPVFNDDFENAFEELPVRVPKAPVPKKRAKPKVKPISRTPAQQLAREVEKARKANTGPENAKAKLRAALEEPEMISQEDLFRIDQEELEAERDRQQREEEERLERKRLSDEQEEHARKQEQERVRELERARLKRLADEQEELARRQRFDEDERKQREEEERERLLQDLYEEEEENKRQSEAQRQQEEEEAEERWQCAQDEFTRRQQDHRRRVDEERDRKRQDEQERIIQVIEEQVIHVDDCDNDAHGKRIDNPQKFTVLDIYNDEIEKCCRLLKNHRVVSPGKLIVCKICNMYLYKRQINAINTVRAIKYKIYSGMKKECRETRGPSISRCVNVCERFEACPDSINERRCVDCKHSPPHNKRRRYVPHTIFV